MNRLLCFSLILLASGCCALEDAGAKFWLRHVEKMSNWIQADVEALKYKDEEPEARLYLQELRKIASLHAISQKLKADGFHWRREAVDFTNYPWVTIAKRRGDCDDFMMLWDAILNYKEGTRQKVFVSSSTGAHAMLLYSVGQSLFLLSNLDVFAMGVPGQEEDLVRKFYKDDTRKIVLY